MLFLRKGAKIYLYIYLYMNMICLIINIIITNSKTIKYH